MGTWPVLIFLLLVATGKAHRTFMLEEDVNEALNVTTILLVELDTLRKNEFDFFKYFAVHAGYSFNSIEMHMRNLGVAESEILQIDQLVNEASAEILIITQKQVANQDELTFLTIQIMANLVNNLPLLPEDKVNLEILLEQTNNDLNSAWRVIFALQESVTQIILDLIDGLVGESAQVIYNFLEDIEVGLTEQFEKIYTNQQQTTNVSNSLLAALEEVIQNHLG